MLRKNLLLLYTKEDNYISDFIYGSFEPENTLEPLKDIIVECKINNRDYKHGIITMRNLTKLSINSTIKLKYMKNFEFNPICIEDSKIKGIINHLYVINTTDEYKSFKINIDKSINASIANREKKNSGFLIFDLPKEVVIPPNNMLMVSASHNKYGNILDYNITERVDLNAWREIY